MLYIIGDLVFCRVVGFEEVRSASEAKTPHPGFHVEQMSECGFKGCRHFMGVSNPACALPALPLQEPGQQTQQCDQEHRCRVASIYPQPQPGLSLRSRYPQSRPARIPQASTFAQLGYRQRGTRALLRLCEEPNRTRRSLHFATDNRVFALYIGTTSVVL